MAPSLFLILSVALFWTLPASVAVLAYRHHDSSVEKLKASLLNSPTPAVPDKAKARVDA